MDEILLGRWIEKVIDVVDTYYNYAAKGVVPEEGETRDGMRAARAMGHLGIVPDKKLIYELLGRGWSWQKVVRETGWKLHFPSGAHEIHSNGERGNLTTNMFPRVKDATTSGLEGRERQIDQVFKHWKPDKVTAKKLRNELHSIGYELFMRRRSKESDDIRRL